MKALLLTNIGQLITLRGPAGPRRGGAMGELTIVNDAAVLCRDGGIEAAGKRREVNRATNRAKFEELDCEGGVVLPGFVDSHTHPVFSAPRLLDFEKRIAGAGYQEIAAAGGGIRSSVEGVRKATRAELARRTLAAFVQMLRQGTTTIEAKSGYGLSVDSEIKSLEAIRAAAEEFPGTVVPTLLGAHVVPKEFTGRPDEYVKEICEQMIPRAARRRLARYVDVFCERGAFTVEQAERIFAAAREHGLAVRAHVSQFTPARLESLLQYEPASLDHMDCAAEADYPLLARSSTVATLLPGAVHFLGHQTYPPARKLIDAGVAVALATDYNPGTSPSPSMPFALSLACTHMNMTPAEAITAATINGAAALGLSHQKGSIETGRDADLAWFSVSDYREIPYWFGADLCAGVVAGGVPLIF